ncbi:MAG TPA: Crp/Fnr family transcriptional regulator, partial [Geminicoccaceae bacterium]
MSTPKMSQFAAVDLLAGLSPADLEQVTPRFRTRAWPKGHCIVGHRDESRDVYIVLDGKVRVTLFSERGKEVSFRDLEAGSSFGELSAIDGQPRSADVVATKEATLVGSVAAGEFLELMRRHPAIASATTKKLAMLVRALSQRIYESAERAAVRIVNELIRLAEVATTDGKSARIRPRPKDAEVASRVNSHREAVSRVISQLARS